MNLFFTTKFDADVNGHFGEYGGRYAPELLMEPLLELEKAYEEAKHDKTFKKDLLDLFHEYSGRPTPLYYAKNLTKHLGGAKIFIKNEGLNHTGAHKINHCLGQALLAKNMGKSRIIAETGAGQHGMATATVAAKFGFEGTIYMGEIDMKRQRPNVFWMQTMGSTVKAVTHGTKRLKDAVNAALKDWIQNSQNTHYIIGSCLGPHPYPSMNRDFQSIIGLEVKKQIQEYGITKPDHLIACVGGGSNAMGLYNAFLDDSDVHITAVEAGGKGVETIGNHAARFQGGSCGVVEGYKSLFLQDEDGQIQPTHSVSAGLDYPGISPQIAHMAQLGRVHITYALDSEVIEAFKLLSKTEGIIPALESSHAVAEAIKLAPQLSAQESIVVNLSGRGDKDIFIIAEALSDNDWKEFIRDKAKETGEFGNEN